MFSEIDCLFLMNVSDRYLNESEKDFLKDLSKLNKDPNRKPITIVDFGSGYGRMIERVQPYLKNNDKYIAYDISLNMLYLLSEKHPNAFITDDIQALKNISIDYLICFDVFKHINPLISFSILEKINELEYNKAYISLEVKEDQEILDFKLPSNNIVTSYFYSNEMLESIINKFQFDKKYFKNNQVLLFKEKKEEVNFNSFSELIKAFSETVEKKPISDDSIDEMILSEDI